MRNKLILAAVGVVVLSLGAVTAAAQSGFRVRTAPAAGRMGGSGVQTHVFIPNFGLTPVVRERFPVFGLGFDAHHHRVIHGGFGGGFFGNNFFGTGFFGTGFFGSGLFSAFPAVSSSSVVVVPQIVPVEVPVLLSPRDDGPRTVVSAGLPEDWGKLRIAASSYPRERAPLAQLTLLVQKDQTIFAVTDYWLEDGRIFYVTSTGRQDSIALRDLDWETTNQLNAERGVDFVLHSR